MPASHKDNETPTDLSRSVGVHFILFKKLEFLKQLSVKFKII